MVATVFSNDYLSLKSHFKLIVRKNRFLSEDVFSKVLISFTVKGLENYSFSTVKRSVLKDILKWRVDVMVYISYM